MAICDAIKPQEQGYYLKDDDVTDDMKWELLNEWRHSLTNIQLAMFESGAMSPLCGWGFAYQFNGYKPPLEMSIAMPHENYTFKSFDGNPDLIIQAVKIIKTGIKKERAAVKRQTKIAKQNTKYTPVYIPTVCDIKPLELEPVMA